MTANLPAGIRARPSAHSLSVPSASQHARPALVAAALAAAFIGLTAAPGTVQAAEFDWRARQVNVGYQERPLADVIRELFAGMNVPVVISERIQGTVTGKFSQSAEDFMQNLSTAFGLLSYYDGSVYYVYSSGEAVSRVLSLRGLNTARFRQSLREMDIADRRHQVRINESEKLVTVSGPPRFVDAVEGVVNLLQQANARPAGSGVPRSPSARALNSGFRIFPLRYAWAQDTSMTVGGREIVVPGVATTLRRLAGNYQNSGHGGYGAYGGYGSMPQFGGAVVAAPAMMTGAGNPNTVPGVRGTGLAADPSASMRSGGGIGVAPVPGGAGVPGQPGAGYGAFPGVAGGGLYAVDPMGGGYNAAYGAGYGSATMGLGMVNVSLPRIEGDARTNSVIVHDVPERLGRYDDLMAAMDVKTAVVQIDATIVDISTDSLDKLGIDWSASSTNLAFGRGSGALDGTFRQGAASASTQILGNVVAGAATGGAALPLQGLTTVVGNAGRLFLAQVNALAQQGKAFVHSRPSVLTMNNLEAVLENTQTFYVRVAGERQVDLFNITSGTVLRVTPALVDENGERRVKMAIRIEDGSLTGRLVDSIPLVQRTTVGTNAMVVEGQSLLVGGYAYDVNREIENKLPLLGDIPALGALFSFRNRSVSRVERMFMITPRIVTL